MRYFDICGVYPGFDTPEWVDLTTETASTLQYGEFRLAAWDGVEAVLHGKTRSFVLPGYPNVDPGAEARTHPAHPAGLGLGLRWVLRISPHAVMR